MKPFQIKLTRPAEKELLKLSKVVRAKIIESLEVLASNPFAEILQFKKLRGREDLYRIRVGRYRIIYSIQANLLIILVVRIGHRKDVYGYLKRAM